MEFKLKNGGRIAVNAPSVAALIEIPEEPTLLVLVSGIEYEIAENFEEAHKKLRGLT
jgi:hypothetical protein